MAKPQQVLILEPNNELIFKGPFTECVNANLTLSNPSQRAVYFKVKLTAPKFYCVRPNFGVIQAKDKAQINVMLHPVESVEILENERNPHKFMIQSAFAQEGDQPPTVEQFWKSVDPTQIMDSKLRVVFHQPYTLANATDYAMIGNANDVSGTQSPAKVYANVHESSPHPTIDLDVNSQAALQKEPELRKIYQDEKANIEKENYALMEQRNKQKPIKCCQSTVQRQIPSIVRRNPKFDDAKVLRSHLLPVWQRLWNAEAEYIVFRFPVDPIALNIPDYPYIIKSPMDLTTIKANLDHDKYKNAWQFFDHMWLMFDNAWLYNRKNTKVLNWCTMMSEIFIETIDPVMRQMGYCCGQKRIFTPLVQFCSGRTNCVIPRNQPYRVYERSTNGGFGTPAIEHIIYCTNCFKRLPRQGINLADKSADPSNWIAKSKFKMKKNDEIVMEPFEECQICERKWHKICAMHSNKITPEGFICEPCRIKTNRPKPENKFTAKKLPQCQLSRFIEQRTTGFLRQELTQSDPKVEVVIRVVCNTEKEVEVKPEMVKKYGPQGYPTSFPYRSKVVFAFEVVKDPETGSEEEICFFGLYLQEYGTNCAQPNRRHVNIAYLDSVHYFQPPHLRTKIYYEILLGYLQYAKKLGYTHAHIWSCPPEKDVDYIFHCHPPEQKIPTKTRLQNWYKTMLDIGIAERTVHSYNNILDQAKEDNLDSPMKLPYFDGDQWPESIEECISEKRNNLKRAKSTAEGNHSVVERLYQHLENLQNEFFTIRLFSPHQEKIVLLQKPQIVDPNPLIDSELADLRNNFLEMSREEHWQFSELRRVKWSSRELCHMLHRQDSYTCDMCEQPAQYHCQICQDFDLCESCKTKNPHQHELQKLLVERETADALTAAVSRLQNINKQIDRLVQMKSYAELKDVLMHNYDWDDPSADDAHANKMFLLIECFRECGDPWERTVVWIIRILALLAEHKVIGKPARRLLLRCFTVLSAEKMPSFDDQLHNGNQSMIKQLGLLLVQLANADQYPDLVRSMDLWIWCHRIAKYLEERDLYNHFESEKGPIRKLPTKSLLILSKAHEVLGKSKRCWKKKGRFLNLLLDEFTHVLNDPNMKDLLRSPEIRENTIFEIIQCLHCLSRHFWSDSQVVADNSYLLRSTAAGPSPCIIGHGSELEFEADWDLALRVLPHLAPAQLPKMSSADTRVYTDFVNVTTNMFEHLLQIESCQLERLDTFCQNPPHFELDELFDENGHCCGYEDKLKISKEGKKRLKELAETTHQEADDMDNKKAELKAKMLYLLAHYHNHSGNNTDEACEYLQMCLSIGHSHLPADILSSAWHAYGQTRIKTYMNGKLSDDEFLATMDTALLPFNMAIYLKWEFPEAHSEIEQLMHELRRRYKTFSYKISATAEKKEKIRNILHKMERYPKARLQFRMAQHHPKSIGSQQTFSSNKWTQPNSSSLSMAQQQQQSKATSSVRIYQGTTRRMPLKELANKHRLTPPQLDFPGRPMLSTNNWIPQQKQLKPALSAGITEGKGSSHQQSPKTMISKTMTTTRRPLIEFANKQVQKQNTAGNNKIVQPQQHRQQSLRDYGASWASQFQKQQIGGDNVNMSKRQYIQQPSGYSSFNKAPPNSPSSQSPAKKKEKLNSHFPNKSPLADRINVFMRPKYQTMAQNSMMPTSIQQPDSTKPAKKCCTKLANIS